MELLYDFFLSAASVQALLLHSTIWSIPLFLLWVLVPCLVLLLGLQHLVYFQGLQRDIRFTGSKTAESNLSPALGLVSSGYDCEGTSAFLLLSHLFV